jgi:hypothetical protein
VQCDLTLDSLLYFFPHQIRRQMIHTVEMIQRADSFEAGAALNVEFDDLCGF